jgi:hypothetical protein
MRNKMTRVERWLTQFPPFNWYSGVYNGSEYYVKVLKKVVEDDSPAIYFSVLIIDGNYLTQGKLRGVNLDTLRGVSKGEILNILSAEAKKRGLVDGARIESKDNITLVGDAYSYSYSLKKEWLIFGGNIIYDEGVWVTLKED